MCTSTINHSWLSEVQDVEGTAHHAPVLPSAQARRLAAEGAAAWKAEVAAERIRREAAERTAPAGPAQEPAPAHAKPSAAERAATRAIMSAEHAAAQLLQEEAAAERARSKARAKKQRKKLRRQAGPTHRGLACVTECPPACCSGPASRSLHHDFCAPAQCCLILICQLCRPRRPHRRSSIHQTSRRLLQRKRRSPMPSLSHRHAPERLMHQQLRRLALPAAAVTAADADATVR